MKIDKVLLLVGLSLCFGSASAGTVTIKSPPEGLTLLTTSGVVKHGDKDLVLTSQTQVEVNISPQIEVDGTPHIIGMASVDHRPNTTTQLHSNDTLCRSSESAQGYSVTIELVGYRSVTCRNGEFKSNKQLVADGSANVVVTYDKLPKSD
jgi:hypothetical protein